MSEHLINIDEARANLLACAAYLAESIKSADGHAETMKTIVPFYIAKSNVDLAAEFANTVDDPFTRDRLLTAVAEKCAAIDDDEAIGAFDALCRYEGIIPALESSHALAHAIKIAPTLGKDKAILVNLSGRGDKDMNTVARIKGITL